MLNWGVAVILWLQGFSPELDLPFRFLSHLGSEGFYLFLFPFIYWCVDRRVGARLAVLFLFSGFLNDAAKVIAGQPRPFEYDPRVRALAGAGGGGLPSGHTQHAVVVWGYLASVSRRIWAWCVAVFLMLAIPLSRLYLGVHFPTDLLGGYLLGAALLIAFIQLGPRIEAGMMRMGIVGRLCLVIAIPAFLILAAPSGMKDGISAASALMGMGAGMVLERRWIGFQTEGLWWKRLLRFLIGIAVSLSLWAGLRSAFAAMEPEVLFRVLRYALLGFWAALGAPWIFLRLRLTCPEQSDVLPRVE